MPKKLPPVSIGTNRAESTERASTESGKRYRLGRFDTLIDAKASLAIARTDVARAISVPRLRAARKRSAQWRKLRVLK